MDNFKLVRFTDENIELMSEPIQKNEIVWLTAKEMAELFDVKRPDVVKHVNKIINLNELSTSTCAFLAQVQIEGTRKVKRTLKSYG